ncbi:MAG: M23 family metallopeptidase [Bdellovibrionia bacterium]
MILEFAFGLLLAIHPAAAFESVEAVNSWERLADDVRDGKIPKEQALKDLKVTLEKLNQWAGAFSYEKNQKWIFPLKGYALSSIGGKRGDGYQPDIVYGASPIKGYDFFDGNRHGGHPAHDIFIADKNQDSLDDKTKNPVDVIAIVDAAVIGTDTDWKPGSPLRGGNVIWLYSSELKLIFYYAHLGKISAQPGQFKKAGEALGHVGRTGLLAEKPKSPTHIHLMVLKPEGNTLVPVNYYSNLKAGVSLAK